MNENEYRVYLVACGIMTRSTSDALAAAVTPGAIVDPLVHYVQRVYELCVAEEGYFDVPGDVEAVKAALGALGFVW